MGRRERGRWGEGEREIRREGDGAEGQDASGVGCVSDGF
jgi:hypothetical protein